jgi:hypothetical protein
MFLQKVKPTTASRRQLIKLNNKSLNLSKKPLLKTHLAGKKIQVAEIIRAKLLFFIREVERKKNIEKSILKEIIIRQLSFVQ